MTKYLSNDDRQMIELMLVEMRLEGAPEMYVRGLRDQGYSRVFQHHAWWMEHESDKNWRPFIVKQFQRERE